MASIKEKIAYALGDAAAGGIVWIIILKRNWNMVFIWILSFCPLEK